MSIARWIAVRDVDVGNRWNCAYHAGPRPLGADEADSEAWQRWANWTTARNPGGWTTGFSVIGFMRQSHPLNLDSMTREPHPLDRFPYGYTQAINDGDLDFESPGRIPNVYTTCDECDEDGFLVIVPSTFEPYGKPSYLSWEEMAALSQEVI